MKADTLGFLSPQGSLPEADPSLGEHIDLMHVTAVPPTIKNGVEILQGNDRFPGLVKFRQIIEQQSNLTIIESSEDLEDLSEQESTGVVLGMQETPYDVNREMLQEFYEHGVRVITPSYQEADHPIGSGYTNPEKPLTHIGKQFLLDCYDTGLIVDLSHLGHQTARDVLDFREKEGINLPVLASHGGIYELYDGNVDHINNLRNLPWDVVERIADEDGIVGIYALTFGLSEYDDSLKPLTTQIAAAVKRLGQDAVAIGTDAIYKHRGETEWKRTTEWLIGLLAKSGELEPRYPDIPFVLNEVGKLAVIEHSLDSAGHNQNAIGAITGDNAFRFFGRNL